MSLRKIIFCSMGAFLCAAAGGCASEGPKPNDELTKAHTVVEQADKGGAAQISTAMRVLAEIIASDVSLLVTFNQAIDGVIQNNPKARANPKALAQLDGYKRPLVSSLSGNLQRFGMERSSKLESLQDHF